MSSLLHPPATHQPSPPQNPISPPNLQWRLSQESKRGLPDASGEEREGRCSGNGAQPATLSLRCPELPTVSPSETAYSADRASQELCDSPQVTHWPRALPTHQPCSRLNSRASQVLACSGQAAAENSARFTFSSSSCALCTRESFSSAR